MRGPYDVWAPRPQRVRLQLGSEVVEMVRGDDGWWAPAEPLPADDGRLDYGYLLDDDPAPRPDPRSRRQPDGVFHRFVVVAQPVHHGMRGLRR